MAILIRAFDWAATPLGPPETWSAALRTAVRITLESPFPINLWMGPDLRLLYNDAYAPVLGAKHPRALGQPGTEVWQEIWHDIAPMFDSIRAGGPPAYASDARFVMEREGSKPDAAWFTFSLSAVRDDDGQIVAFLNIVSETTARINAEREALDARAAAERAEHHLREVFAQAPAFMAVLRGEQHVFDFVNDAYLTLIGHRDVIGKTVADALPEVREQGFIAILDRVLGTGEPFIGREIPIMLARTPGAPLEQVYVDFVYQPINEATGERIGIVAHGSDVTAAVKARKEIERLLQESERARNASQHSEASYRFLANTIPVQVWTARADGSLDYVSDRAAQYFGKSADEVIGDQWLSVLHPDDVERTMRTWGESLASARPYQVEFRLWSAAHNDYRWHLGRATPQRDAEGKIVRWFGTNTEIEDRKQVEEELERLTAEATEANHAKSAFLAAMSHELRTPLNAIGGYAQLIEMGVRGPITEDQRIDLLKIQRSKNHLDALVSDVLSFAKLGSGKIEYRIRQITAERCIQAVLEMVVPQMNAKKLRLEVSQPPVDLTFAADEDKVRQILINLLGNALKFTPTGGTISVDVKHNDNEVGIDVRDTGIGVPAEHIERIFEPFMQSKRALNTSDQGVGLGLAISRQLARAMRGDLTVQSTVGKGSTFTLTLPRRTLSAS